MRKLIAFALLAALLLSLTACGAGGTGDGGVTVPEGLKIAEEGDGYTFIVPEEWVVDTTTGITTAYVSPIDPSNITLVRVKTEETPEAYFAASEKELASRFEGYTLLADACSDKTTLGDKAAIVRVYGGKLVGTPYVIKQYLCRSGDYLYLFTCTAEDVTLDAILSEEDSNEKKRYEKFEKMADTSASYFAFTGTAYPPAEEEGEPPVTNADGLVLISDPAVSRYSLYVPAAWTPDLRNGMTSATREGAVLTLLYEVPREGTPGEYWERMNNDYKTLYENYDLIEEECSKPAKNEEDVEVWVDGRQAVRYVFTFTRAGVTYKTQKFLILEGIYIYTLTYTAAYTGDGQDAYTAYLPDLAAILSAFTFD